jgi:hypothetical protein
VEQYQKFSSDEIGRSKVDLHDALASLTPILPPVLARSLFSITTRSEMLEGKIHPDVFTSH